MLGDRIKQIRKTKNISQKDFAKILKIPVSTLANYENNHREPNINTLNKIANALDISPLELFPNHDTDNSNNEDEYSYIQSKEFETITATYILQKVVDEKDNIIIPFIKYINDTYLESKYDIDKLLKTSSNDLLNNNCDYSYLKRLLVDIIDCKLMDYERKQNELFKILKEKEEE